MQVKFSATKLPVGKKGIIKPDENGYYTQNLGALNVFNSASEFYDLEGAKILFEESSSFMRKVRNGCVKPELGHPKKLPGMTDDQYLSRVFRIEETNTCAHISDVWLDYVNGKNLGQGNIVLIMGKVKPAGPFGYVLKEAYENGPENVCFSIRSITKDYYDRGTKIKVLDIILNFDYVTEPGIFSSTKWMSPSLEDISSLVITKPVIQSMINNNSLSNISQESDNVILKQILTIFDNDTKTKPLYTNW